MSYYGARGDFYTGRTGYYRAGDPGFFSSIGSIFKKVVPIAASVFGGPVGGAVASGLLGGGGGGGSAPQQPSISAAGFASRSALGAARVSGAARTLPSMGGSRPGMGLLGPMRAPGVSMGRVAGRHMSTLARTGMRKRPSMNVCNPRALRRAIRRAKGFEKIALRSIRLVHPQRLHGKRRGGFKISRRRK
jgi:hypothetical protein